MELEQGVEVVVAEVTKCMGTHWMNGEEERRMELIEGTWRMSNEGCRFLCSHSLERYARVCVFAMLLIKKIRVAMVFME